MTIPGERDESLERWLRQLRPGRDDATGACLDAEAAAAWVAGGLSGEALHQAEVHLADCDRCQTLVGSLVRAGVGRPSKAQAPKRNWMRVLVPLATAATIFLAVGVWVSLPREISTPAKAKAGAPSPAGALENKPAAPAATKEEEIATPDPSVRWRINGRQVQRSHDRGATWDAAHVGTAAAFTAGAAPSRSVCWFVGRGGIVLLTTDGISFTRVPFPEPADLMAVSATDARSAIVTTADGRRFRTSDGGATWGR